MSAFVHSCWILSIIFVVLFCDRTSAQVNYAKFDFNRTSIPDYLSNCKGRQHPNFVVEPYALGKFQSYLRNAMYYLTTNFFSIICAETRLPIPLSIKAGATIEVAINFKSVGKAFTEIIVYDNDQNLRKDSIRNDGTPGWIVLKKKIPYDIQNARIEIYADMNEGSSLAIEFINLLSSDIECIVPVWCWILIALCLIIAIASIASATAYGVLEKRRSRSHNCANK